MIVSQAVHGFIEYQKANLKANTIGNYEFVLTGLLRYYAFPINWACTLYGYSALSITQNFLLFRNGYHNITV